jgi:hypothetical protein
MQVLRMTALRETACPVCGLPGAFIERGWYDTCSRCGWVDVPDGAQYAGEAIEINGASLDDARTMWPARAAALAAAAPTSVLTVLWTAPSSENRPDYAVDGRALGPLLWSRMPAATPFSPQLRRFARSLVAELLLECPASAPSGRVALYVCSECAGPECGFTSAHVARHGDRIIWSALGTESPDDDAPRGAFGWSFEPAAGPAGFAFDEKHYRAALLGALRD